MDATFVFCLKSVRKEFHVGLGKYQLSKSQNMESMLMPLDILCHCHCQKMIVRSWLEWLVGWKWLLPVQSNTVRKQYLVGNTGNTDRVIQKARNKRRKRGRKDRILLHSFP